LFIGTLSFYGQNTGDDNFKGALEKFENKELSKEEIQEYLNLLTLDYENISPTYKITHYTHLVEQMINTDLYKQAKNYTDTLLNIYGNETSEELANVYVNQSLIFDALGQYPEGLAASQKALNIYAQLNDLNGQAICFSDIGVFHYYRGKDSLARVYLDQAFDIYQNLADSSGMAQCYNNIANTYFETDDYLTAIDTYTKGLEIDQRLNDIEGQSIFLSNIGETYTYMKEYDKAEEYLQKSLKLAESLNDPWTISNPLRGLGELYQTLGNTEEAIKVVQRSVLLCLDIDALPELASAYNQLFELYYSKGNYKEAILYHELYYQANDSIFNIEKEAMFNDMEMQYQVKDKNQKLILAQKNKEVNDLAHQKEIDKNKERQNLILVGLLCVGVVLIIVVINVVQKKKANKLLRNQNKIIQEKNIKINTAYLEIEEKSNEILDSINYAKRIQSAILPSSKSVTEFLPNSFILYKPKDIVAGDFYWLEHKNNKVLFAAADCTGHGVPGAMVSVVCNNALNRSVREYGLTDPGKILDKTKKLVVEEFEKSEDEVKDGMDIALCCLENNKLSYAGANNPLWIYRKGELLHWKADHQPIGKYEFEEPFTTHEIELLKGDTIYIFSDGYPDQFGGERGKKYKSTNLKSFLLSIQSYSIEEQKMLMEEEFENWRGNHEQIDDVCVIGVRI